MNHMSEVANILGVELCEEFDIVFPNEDCHATALINNDGLYIKTHNLANADYWHLSALTKLLNGVYAIKRKPWKPNEHEIYWMIDERGLSVYDEWMNTSTDLNFYKLGNCYKTEEEAQRDTQKWVDFYSSDEILEV